MEPKNAANFVSTDHEHLLTNATDLLGVEAVQRMMEIISSRSPREQKEPLALLTRLVENLSQPPMARPMGRMALKFLHQTFIRLPEELTINDSDPAAQSITALIHRTHQEQSGGRQSIDIYERMRLFLEGHSSREIIAQEGSQKSIQSFHYWRERVSATIQTRYDPVEAADFLREGIYLSRQGNEVARQIPSPLALPEVPQPLPTTRKDRLAASREVLPVLQQRAQRRAAQIGLHIPKK